MKAAGSTGLDQHGTAMCCVQTDDLSSLNLGIYPNQFDLLAPTVGLIKDEWIFSEVLEAMISSGPLRALFLYMTFELSKP
jgi:hypothetical protein